MNNTKIFCQSGVPECEVLYEVLFKGFNFVLDYSIEVHNCTYSIFCRDISGNNIIKPTTALKKTIPIDCKQGMYFVGVHMKRQTSDSYVIVNTFDILASSKSIILKRMLKLKMILRSANTKKN